MTIRTTLIHLAILAAVWLLFVALAKSNCDVPITEQCGTDTECECLHGPDL